ncbi:hypothetical protein [Arenibacter algicola]|uniref:hypothetical protein n=1 Tax=Arenibacter algicola TaxID=616991 RepID=UPI00114F3DF6
MEIKIGKLLLYGNGFFAVIYIWETKVVYFKRLLGIKENHIAGKSFLKVEPNSNIQLDGFI